VSFGLPNREGINGAFLNMAIASGLTSAITNPVSDGVRTSVMASDVLMGNDRDAARWIRRFRVEPTDGDVGRRRVNRRRGPAGNGSGQRSSADVPGVDVPGLDVPAVG
jgi:5-methyltetrahydrofolate--homocysteine methyltransferase